MTFLVWLASSALEAGKLGYALSGGGARGYAHIGIIKVLEEQGIYPDYIAGTSFGAVAGAYYAMGCNAAELEELLLKLDVPELLDDAGSRGQVNIAQKRWPTYGNLSLEIGSDWKAKLPSSLYVGNQLNLELARLAFPASSIQDFSRLPIPFVCVATDLSSGAAAYLDQGSLMQAVRASISVPSLMQPFSFGGRTFIDGGIAQNMPIQPVRNLGADAVIGLKVNSRLRPAEELNDAIEIIDQTVNIGMTRNINSGLPGCDLLLEPPLEGWNNMDFSSSAAIVAAGEAYAREHLPQIIAFRDSLLAAGYVFHKPEALPRPERYLITAISVVGNHFLSSAKIRSYAGLESGKAYSAGQLVKACLAVWNTQYFYTAYPVLQPYGAGYRLELNVREKQRAWLALNLAYTDAEGLNAGSVLTLNNLVLKNSILKAGLTLGGRTEGAVDYVKNFGEFWGSYFRIFPYLSESRLYLYDADHFKVASVRALEYGVTPGIGVFARDLAVAEAFFYSYRKKLYRDVSATAPLDSLYLISGLGVKLYHESLDDDVFPRSGISALAKFNFARWPGISDQVYNRFLGELDVYSKLSTPLSLRLGLNYGSYFGAEAGGSYDPFYFSGARGYRGYDRYAISSASFKVYTLALVANPWRNTYLETGIQGLNVANGDSWGADQDLQWCLYADLGYRSWLGPLRAGAAIRKEGRPNFYLNVGYDLDPFWFSRK